MNTSIRSFALGLILAAASVLGTTNAHAQTVITSLPYTISTKGVYVLNSDLTSSQTSGSLITVSASNVTIDLQGHYISGAAGVTNQTTIGISANEKSNVTIKNGTIAYCRMGIYLTGNAAANTNAVDAQIDNMRITYCYYLGIECLDYVATRITNCQVSQGGYSGASVAYGIILGEGSSQVASGCVVSRLAASTTFGILSTSNGGFAQRNIVSGCTNGIYGGKYQDNLTSSCTNPVSNGVDAGGNN